jgi:Ca2+-binding EF-hand superfamily protein
MKRVAGLLVATTHLGLAGHALAQGPSKGSQAAKRSAAVSSTPLKRVESLGSALGGSPPPKATPASLFHYADTDRDGSVSFGEFAALAQDSMARRIARRFQQLDRDHDGRCTRAEVNKMSSTRFMRFDLDRNGYFTRPELALVMRQELTPRLELAYARLDVDRDGRFSAAELTPIPVQPKPAATGRKLQVASRRASATH